MAAKNSIRVKKQFEKRLLRAALSGEIKLKKCKVASETHVFYTMEITNFQAVFELGYIFNELHRENL
jgi:lipopolysaccharide biosynthesis protein